MKTKMKIFNVIFMAVICAVPAATHATEDCPYFSPALALCSVHAYNVGDSKNPTDVGRASEIEEVIGMKTTVMVQQLKQQYDELNAVIKRFKTQLNKAVLTSKIEVLTGNTSSSTNSSSGGYSSNNTGLANAEDCGSLSKADTYDCLLRNLNKINQAAEKDPTNARKQLINDLIVADGYKMCSDKKCTEDLVSDCSENVLRGSGKAGIIKCTQQLRYNISSAKEDFEDKKNQSRYGWR